MTEAEYIKTLELDLKAMTARAERAEGSYAAAKLTIKATVKRAEEAEQRVETMRQIACEIAKRTNQQQRIAAGEKE